MKRILVALPCLLLLGIVHSVFLGPSSARNDETLYRVSDGKNLSLSSAIPDLQSARIILIGETHSSKRHHEIQLEIIRALHDAGTRLAVGLEMFRRDDQKTLDRWHTGNVVESDFIKIYYDNWSAPWPLYADIFLYARDKRLPMVGLNVSREITRQVAERGFASLNAAQRKELPPVSCALDEEYKRFIARALDMHGHHGMEFTNFCEAQLLWDTAMAWHAVEYLKGNPDRTLIILTGNNHAWKPGIPRHIASFSNFEVRVILPEESGRAAQGNVTERDADYLWID